jgi:FtsP/CotA-like multicopper oxidase with cupredoxin domain
MLSTSRLLPVLVAVAGLWAVPAQAQSFRVQCPTATALHPSDPADPAANPVGGRIKCQQVGGGDGYATMGDGTQTYLFGFGPLSGLANIANGIPGTQPASVFNADNSINLDSVFIGAPVNQLATAVNAINLGNLSGAPYTFNGAIGLVPDVEALDGAIPPQPPGSNVPPDVWARQHANLTGHVDPRLIMDVGVMNANQPAPLMAIDEDDEFFLTLTNVGMIMRPDLFEQHTIHFHGYPNASSFYDGVPDASVAISIGASFSYYYLAPDAGTYFWHCHISPPEHLQMGMVGQLFVRPRQNRVGSGDLLAALVANNLKAANNPIADPSLPHLPPTYDARACSDILCTGQTPAPAGVTAALGTAGAMYAYNDGDGTTRYDVEYPIQIHGFDPNFHFVGMTFNPEAFVDMKDKYFLLNGRSYPDTVTPGPMQTQSSDGTMHASQPLPTIINIPVGGRALLRISDLDVTEYQTLASLGIPMKVIGQNARLLRDMAGNNMAYGTNSITLAGGESIDVILDATGYSAGQKFYLYTPQMDHLSNDAENFGGLMTEVNICAAVDPVTKACS